MIACLAALLLAPIRPNIVLIFCDDLGYHEVGVNGLKHVETPNIDRLAKGGLQLTRFYTASPVCAPARASLLLGQHTGNTPIRGNKEVGGWKLNEGEGQFALASQYVTIAERLKTAGYTTAVTGKWASGGPGTEGHPNRQGFDYFFGYLCQRQAHNFYPPYLWQNHDIYLLPQNTYVNVHTRVTKSEATDDTFKKFIGGQYSSREITKKATDWIQSRKSEPFFLYFPTTLPHVALQAPPEAVNQFPREWDTQPYLGENGYCPCERPRATYAAMLAELDRSVGELISAVEKSGKLSNTLFIFTSDNGTTHLGQVDREFFGSLGELRGTKSTLYDGGIRVPFFAYWPGKIPARVVDNQFAYVPDLAPTFGKLAGFKGGSFDGLDLSDVLLGGNASEPRNLYFEYPEAGSWQAVILDSRWKVLRKELGKGNKKVEVYDLLNDMRESNDISSSRQDLVQRGLSFFSKHHKPNVDFPLPGIDTKPKP